jgi:LPXTG-motif cell wall-anchored protein
VTGDPINVSGGDGALSDRVCNSIVASTGIFGDGPGGGTEGLLAGLFGDPPGEGNAGSGGSTGSSGTLGLSVLPDTGGAAVLLYLGMLLVAGGGLIVLRHRALRGSR